MAVSRHFGRNDAQKLRAIRPADDYFLKSHGMQEETDKLW